METNDYEKLLKSIELLTKSVNENKSESITDKMFSKMDEEADLYPTKETGFYHQTVSKDGRVYEKPDYHGLATYMKGEFYLKSDDSLIYLWNGKFYRSISLLQLKNIINGLVKTESSPTVINNFCNKSLILSYQDFEASRTPSGFLNCANGVVDIKQGKLLKHDPKRFIKYVLEHDFDPVAECPTFLRALDLVTQGDEDLKRLLAQIFGYCAIGGYPKAHKAFMFSGSGGNGKSTIITALRNLLGARQNCAHVPLTHFDKPFSMISLDGALVNLIDETPKFNINAEAFKNVVSGGYVRAAHKGKPEFDLQVTARVIFACNELPNFKDTSDGLLRRLLIVPFDNKIEKNEKDPDIDDKIKAEMSGVLNWAIDGLRDLIECNYEFFEGKAAIDAKEEFQMETDSVHRFWKEEVDFADGPNGKDAFYPTSDAYSDYKTFCENEGLYPLGKNNFAKKSVRPWETMLRENGVKGVIKINFMRRKKSHGRGFRYALKRSDFLK